MKRTFILTMAAFAAALCFGYPGSEVTVPLDLARKNTALSLMWTEYCDNAVRITVRRGGEEFPVEGWDCSLVLGGTSSGCIAEGLAIGYNEVLFTVPASSIPTNGKYTVQITAMRNRRSEEWGRGNLRVNLNPGMDYMPTCWMGYQKVAKLAASMLTAEALSNEFASALAEKTTVSVPAYYNIRACMTVVQSRIEADVPREASFMWDGSNAVERVMRSADVPNGRFLLDEAFTVSTSVFMLGGETFRPAEADGLWRYTSDGDESRSFQVGLSFAIEATTPDAFD